MTSGRLRSKAGGSVNVSLSGAPGARVMVPPAGGRPVGDTCTYGHGDSCTARRIEDHCPVTDAIGDVSEIISTCWWDSRAKARAHGHLLPAVPGPVVLARGDLDHGVARRTGSEGPDASPTAPRTGARTARTAPPPAMVAPQSVQRHLARLWA